MKNKLVYSIVAGCTAPFFLNAQALSFSDPSTAPLAFIDTLKEMHSAANGTNNLPNVPAPESLLLNFDGTIGNGESWDFDFVSPIHTSSPTSGNAGLYFTKVNNPSFFRLDGSPSSEANIGFFGWEAADLNDFGIQEFVAAGFDVDSPGIPTVSEDIWTYNGPAILPSETVTKVDLPVARELKSTTGDDVIFRFTHTNTTNPLKTQESATKFTFYQQYNPDAPDQLQNAWIIAIDDRENNAIDWDDGWFFLSGEGLTPVPEPSLIAGLALIGLGGIVFFRRRKIKADSK